VCVLRSRFNACKVVVISWTGFVLRAVIWGHNRNCISASCRIMIMIHEFGRTEGKWAWSSWRVIALEFDCSNWDTWTLPGQYESQGTEQNWMCTHYKLSVTRTGRLVQDTWFICIYLRFFYFAYKCHTQSREGGGIDTAMNNRSNKLNGVYDLWVIKWLCIKKTSENEFRLPWHCRYGTRTIRDKYTQAAYNSL